jgi:Tfp pilus assembly protein PilV
MLVATVVLAIGVAGTLGAISAATHAEAVADRMHTAALLARQQLTTTESNLAGLSAGDQSGDFGSDYSEFSWRQSVQSTDDQYLFQVTLTVQWGDPNSPQKYVVTTYLDTEQAINIQNNGSSSTTTGTGGTTGGSGG